MHFQIEDILEIHEMYQIRDKMDAITVKLNAVGIEELNNERDMLILEGEKLLDKLVRHREALRRSMLIPLP